MHQNSLLNLKNLQNFPNEGSPLGRIISLVAFLFFAIFAAFASIQRFSPSRPLRQRTSDDAADIRERFAALSSSSRANRRAKPSFQQFLPYFPPAISADNRHK